MSKKVDIATKKEKPIEKPIEELNLKEKEIETGPFTENQGFQSDDELSRCVAASAPDSGKIPTKIDQDVSTVKMTP